MGLSVHPVLSVLLAWVVLGGVLTGVGAAFVGSTSGGPTSRLEQFWVGVSLLLFFGNTWHLVFPLAASFWYVPVAVSVFGWVRTRHAGVSLGADELLLVAFAVWLAGHCLAPVSSPDAGLYHVQTVRWYAAAPVVPGLGNLNPYACFNHAYFVLPAAFGIGPFADRGWHLANGLLVVAAMPPAVNALLTLLRGQANPAKTGGFIFTAVLAASLIDTPLFTHLSGPTADVATLAAGTYALARAFVGPQTSWRVSGVLYAGLFSLKLTSAPALLAAGLIELSHAKRRQPRQFLGALGLAAASLLPWLAHGVVLSGYVLYPAALRLPVDWAVPSQTAQGLQEWAWAFARWPGHSADEVRSVGWVARWLEVQWLDNRGFLIPLLMGLASLTVVSVRRRWGQTPPPLRAAVAACGVGLVAWWVLLPDLRFAGPLWWALAGASLGCVVSLMASPPRLLINASVLGLVFGGLLFSASLTGWPAAFPDLPASKCTPTQLASGEPACQRLRNSPCFERMCAESPADTIATRTPSRGFRYVARGQPVKAPTDNR